MHWVRVWGLAMAAHAEVACAQDDAPLPPTTDFEAEWQSLTSEMENGDADVTAMDIGARAYRFVSTDLARFDFAERFRELSTLVQGANRDVASLAELNRRVRVDRTLLISLLRAEGYYDPLVTVEIEAEADGVLTVGYAIDEGPLYRLGTVDAPGLS
ncbi:MAG: hypothetical protein WA906_00795, partial [Pacificimonas sp.]